MIRGAGAAAAAAASGAAARRNYAQVSSTEQQPGAADEHLESYQHDAAATAATSTATASNQDVEMSSPQPPPSASSRRIGTTAVAVAAAAGVSRQRLQYSRLSVSAGDDDDDEDRMVATPAAAAATTGSPTNSKNNKSSTDTAAASTTTAAGLNNNNNNNSIIAPSGSVASSAPSPLNNSNDADDASFYPSNDDGRRLTVIILDVAQKKFHVTVHPDSTVVQLKRAGYRIHKVPADRQRLIYRGKMLQDGDNSAGGTVTTLQSVGIVENNLIVHLFPKPRVVIKDAASSANNGQKKNSNESSNNSGDDTEDDDDDTEGARVPTIVLDSDEAERRSQILVLGSADYVEAQNNVKLFSFMLLIISTIELMTLLSVALGVQQEQDLSGVSGTGGNSGSSGNSNGGGYPYVYGAQDDVLNNLDDGDFRFNNNNTSSSSSSSPYSRGVNPNDIVYAHWTLSSWFDLLISVLGVYVAILGIKASSENTHRLAQLYLYGTLLTGLGWMLWNFIMTYKIDVKVNENRQAARNSTNSDHTDDFYYPVLDNDDIVWQAVSVMVLPGMVWFMCCLKAWQFQYLLREAEQEAEERIRSEWSAMEQAANGTTTTATNTTTGGNDEELALQNPSATMT